MAAGERRLLEAEYDEYADTNANGAAFCRSAALIVSCHYPFYTAICYLDQLSSLSIFGFILVLLITRLLAVDGSVTLEAWTLCDKS